MDLLPCLIGVTVKSVWVCHCLWKPEGTPSPFGRSPKKGPIHIDLYKHFGETKLQVEAGFVGILAGSPKKKDPPMKTFSCILGPNVELRRDLSVRWWPGTWSPSCSPSTCASRRPDALREPFREPFRKAFGCFSPPLDVV